MDALVLLPVGFADHDERDDVKNGGSFLFRGVCVEIFQNCHQKLGIVILIAPTLYLPYIFAVCNVCAFESSEDSQLEVEASSHNY
jgi:hypothetical protein